MRGAWTVSEIRAAEQAAMAELPDGTLMARASAGLAAECLGLLGTAYGARILILAGAGNNGADALYAGARLQSRGVAVTTVLLDPERVHAPALAALRRAGGRTVAADAGDLLTGIDLVVDGILGIGGRGGLRPGAAALAERVAGCGVTVVAVDLPSGVDADTGAVEGAVISADVSVTFGCLKVGLTVGAGAEHAGEVRLVDIGLEPYLGAPPVQVFEARDVAAGLVSPGGSDDKYTRGVVGVVAGSSNYGGAAVLCVGAALHGGAGMVRYIGHAGDAVRTAWPEVVVHEDLDSAGRVQAWVIGPGLGTDGAARASLRHVLRTDLPVLVDADAITLLADNRELLDGRSAPTVLTPHDREFERVFGPVGPDRVGAARRAAAEAGVILLLKGNATVVAAPDGVAYVNRTGTPWLATAGSGDVLSGLAGSILAAGVAAQSDPARSAAAAAYVHGVAGQLAAADGPPSSGDVLRSIRGALLTVRTS